ncbi:MAG: hypothetical protein P8X90_11575 [Desulfobacterales bacterium]|jgi:hypothetical protein
MMTPDRHKKAIERVTEVYIAVFPVAVNEDLSVEVILAGYQKDPNMPNMSRVRATVETHASAVQDLVALCDTIVDEQAEIESYRLLKFDKDGIHVLCADDFRGFGQGYTNAQWGLC